MKNYNEVANKIFQRRDMYIANQKKKRKTVVRLTAVLSSFMLILLIGIVVLQSGLLSVDDDTINNIDNIMPNLTATPAITDEIAALPTPQLTTSPTHTDKITATPTPQLATTPAHTDKVTATPTPFLSASPHKKRFDTVEELVAYAKTQTNWAQYEFIPALKNIENKFVIHEILANETYVWISYVDVNNENIDFPVSLQIGMMTTTDYNGYLGWAKNVIGGTETTINGKPMVVRENDFIFDENKMTETYYLFNEEKIEMSIRVPQWATSLGAPEYFTDLEHISFE